MGKIESKVQKEIITYLEQKRALFFRFQAQSNINGMPDIICLYKGLFIGLELKREKGGKATGLQLKKLDAINENGGIGIVINDVSKLDNLFNIIDNCKDLNATNIRDLYEISNKI